MMVPDYWEPPSTLPPLGNLSLAGKKPRVAQRLGAGAVTVRVTVPAQRAELLRLP